LARRAGLVGRLSGVSAARTLLVSGATTAVRAHTRHWGGHQGTYNQASGACYGAVR
jgi:hypothetical protein